MPTSPSPLSTILMNALRPVGGQAYLQRGQSVAAALLAGVDSPIAIFLNEAIAGVQSQLDSINAVLQNAPTLNSLAINSADIAVLSVGGLYGPGQLTVFGGGPSFPTAGWVGSEAAPFSSPITNIATTVAGVVTTSSAHGLAVNQVVVIAGTSDFAQAGTWRVATVPNATTFTVTGYSGTSTGGTVQRELIGGWFQTLAVGGSSYLNAITNGLFADENGNLTINAATVKGILSAATVLAALLNITGILVANLVLTNNSPGAGNVAWSACTVYLNGTAYSIAAGNTTSGHKYITWTVSNATFTEGNSYTPGPTVYLIATNNNGTGDTAWNKIGAVHIQPSHLQPVLTFDGPNGSLVVSNFVATDNNPAGTVTWAACQATYQGVTYNIPAGSSTSPNTYIIWQLSSPNSFQAVAFPPSPGADGFVIGVNRPSGNPSANGFFSRALSISDHTGARLFFDETGFFQTNAENQATFDIHRDSADAAGNPAGGIIDVQDGSGNTIWQTQGHRASFRQKAITVANLPRSPVASERAFVSDSTVAAAGNFGANRCRAEGRTKFQYSSMVRSGLSDSNVLIRGIMLKGQKKKLLLDRFIKYITIGALIVLTASLAYAQDIGQQIQAQYDSLPARGGVISLTQGGSFSTPICFCTPGKRVLLTGVPGDVVELVYTGTAQWSAAIIFDYGMGHAMGHGMRDITLTGPGNWTNTVGVIFGGNNGAEGFTMRDFKVQGFGVGFALQAHTWIPRIEHGMFRDSRYNVFLPSNMVMAGEQIIFDNVVFADAPAPHTNNVWIMGGGQEVVFRDCSFDQAQLRIGNGSVSAAQVVIDSTHFENSNAGVQGSVPYRYLVVDNNPGNLVRLTNSYFFQGSSNQPDFFVEMHGGTLVMGGNGGWSAAQMSGFITGPGKVVRDQPLVDLGGF